MIMAKLRLRVTSQPGVPGYKPESVEAGSVFSIAIVTEGCKEELIYLRHIKALCEKRGSSATHTKINFVNDEYVSPKAAESESNPLHRLNALLEHLGVTNPDFKEFRTDEAWLVCDRDDGSFTEAQYDDVLKLCGQHHIRWVVSNPAFQLWLLFHFTDALVNLGLEECRTSVDRKVRIEAELKKYVDDYRHGTLNVFEYEENIEDAVVNSRKFCTDLSRLKYDVGTNFADLVDSLRKRFGVDVFAYGPSGDVLD